MAGDKQASGERTADQFERIAIIGTGLVGGSLGLSIKAEFPDVRVVGVSRTKDNLDEAARIGAIDQGFFEAREAVAGADLVFVATPVGSIVDIIRDIHGELPDGAIITDVGSTKGRIVHRVETFLPSALHFIGGHPMAGSEQRGVTAARADLFKGAFYFLTPTQRTDTEAFKRLHSLLARLGAQVIAIDPDKHDRLVGTISHLPHIVSSALMHSFGDSDMGVENPLFMSGRSFREMTRVAASSPEVWLDVCMENDQAILEALDHFEHQVKSFARLIRKKMKDELAAKLEEARTKRLTLAAADEERSAEFWEISVPVADKPGVVSEVTLTIGGLGANIEDLEIVPVTAKSGMLKLVVTEKKKAVQAVESLKQKGYAARMRKV